MARDKIEPVGEGNTDDWRAENDKRSLITVTGAKAFVSPKGDYEWGKKLFDAGVGFDVCKGELMRKGWVDASQNT